MRPSSRRAIARNTAARPSPQTRCGRDNYPACRTHLPPATHRLTAKRSACFSRFHLSNYTSLPCACARRKPCKHGADGFFTKNSAKVHSGSDNQRQSQNAANPRGSLHCGLPRTALAQKSANAFLLLLVGASFISLVSAEDGENSIIPLLLLFPPNPLRWASAGALFCPPQSRGSPRKSARKRLKIPLRGRDAAPPRRRSHSGSQGRTRGFCDLCRQLLLHLLTLQLGHLPLVTLLQDIVHRDDIRYAPGDVKSGRMTEVFSIAICHILCYNALKLKNGAA